MRYRFALFVFLLLPATSRATALAIIEFSGACTGTTEFHGESSAGGSIQCPGTSASAQGGTNSFPDIRPNYIMMNAYSYTPDGLLQTRVTTSFDHLLLVTGTDQPGFLVLLLTDFRYYD